MAAEFASGAARDLAAQLGVEPAAIAGSGRAGRITVADVRAIAAPPAPPRRLGVAGRELWSSVTEGLGVGWELDERELAILTLAARQADDLARLETTVRNYGPMVEGSKAQPVVNPALQEARQARLAIGRLLGQLALPDEGGQPRTLTAQRAQAAAGQRWGIRGTA